MELSKLGGITLVLLSGCCVNCQDTSQSLNPKRASEYQAFVTRRGEHDFSRLQMMAEKIVIEGIQSRDPEQQLLSIYAASLSQRHTLLSPIYQATHSRIPQIQLAAMQGLAASGNAMAEDALIEALSSPYGLIRFEGAHLLTKIGHPLAEAQLDALLAKAPVEAEPIFPQFYANIHTPRSEQKLRRFLLAGDPIVQREALVAVGSAQREDLTKTLLELTPSHQAEEPLAFALGKLAPDDDKLQKLALSQVPEARVAALLALKNRSALFQEAQAGNLWAIDALTQLQADDELLELLDHSELLRVNCAVGLLKLGREEALAPLLPYLTHNAQGLALLPHRSPARTLIRFDVIPSSVQQLRKKRRESLLALQAEEWLLMQAAQLPQQAQLKLAQQVLLSGKSHLVLPAIRLVEQAHAVEELQKYSELPGAPFVRQAASLALYRLGLIGSERLVSFLRAHQTDEAIRLRDRLNLDQAQLMPGEPLTPQAEGALLIDTFLTLASAQTEAAINELLHALENGHPKNRVVIAGLLLRATL